MKHLHHIWKFDVVLEQENPDGHISQVAACRKNTTN